ncbi:MAG: hypothetical protein IGBAC_1303 [Ignavibacteriae bacterium]|nr:MAG: hypothetical protein IGBAC_1303 [Ignavibacteriota bacterium]
MKKLIFISIVTLISLIGCEKKEDPLVRVENNFDFYSDVELKRTDGYTKVFEDIDAHQTTEYVKIPSGYYIVSSSDVSNEVGFQADKNKKYTIELYMTDKQIPAIRIKE